MFGYLRFLLALLVLLSHMGLRFNENFNPGVFAVVIFYMLSGFVSAHLIEKVFIKRQQILSFYWDRILRIYPQYLFVVLLSIIFVTATAHGDPQYQLSNLLNNILIVPLNYYKSIDSSIMQSPPSPLIPPAWSLALELQAYALMPFAIWSAPTRASLGMASFFIFFVANLGIISSEQYGYRLLFGMFFIFILGTSIYHCLRRSSHRHPFDQLFPAVVLVALIVLFSILPLLPGMMLEKFVRETMLGVIIGMPLLILLGQSKLEVPGNRFLGDSSYGVFLSHFLAMWLLNWQGLSLESLGFWPFFAMTISLSIGIAALGTYGVEKSIKKYRFSRTRQSAACS